jgi:hypothetical protein
MATNNIHTIPIPIPTGYGDGEGLFEVRIYVENGSPVYATINWSSQSPNGQGITSTDSQSLEYGPPFIFTFSSLYEDMREQVFVVNVIDEGSRLDLNGRVFSISDWKIKDGECHLRNVTNSNAYSGALFAGFFD